jgi:O-antigen/teichoic acid export membrane protein
MTKPDTKSFLSNAVMYGLGSILLEAASLVLLPLYLNYLTPEDYGILEILNRIGSIVVIGLMANGFRMAALTFYQQATTLDERKQVAATVSVALCLVLVIGTLATFAIAPWLVKWLDLTSKRLLVIGMITVLLEALVIIPLAFMQARIESVRYVSTTLAMFIARVTIIIYLVGVLELGLWGVLIGRAAIAIFFGALLNGLELRASSIKVSIDTFKGVLRFALPFLPGGLLAFFINNGDRFYLIKQAGEHEVGIYSLSYRMASAISMIAFIPLYKVWSAKMYIAAQRNDAPHIFGLMFTRFMASLVCAGLAVALFSEDLLLLMGGQDYLAAVNYLPLLSAAVIMMSAADLMDSGFYVTRNTKYKPVIFLATGIVIFIAYSVLIPRFSGVGAAWATLIAFSVHVLLTWRFTQFLFHVHYERVRLLLLVGSASICWLISALVASAPYRLEYKIALFLGWTAFVCCIANEEERHTFVQVVRRAIRRIRKEPTTDKQELSCGSERV